MRRAARARSLLKRKIYSAVKMIRAPKKVHLESLITKEDSKQLKSIRINEVPKLIAIIGKGEYGQVSLFQWADRSRHVGKQPTIDLYIKSPEDEEETRKVGSRFPLAVAAQLIAENMIKVIIRNETLEFVY